MKKINVKNIIKAKKEGKKIAALTAYDYSTAKYLDEAGIDIILVGDSLAMVALGYDTTHSLETDEMKIFTRAVAKGVNNALVVADMPFSSYRSGIDEASKNACEFIKEGAQAVKIEGCNDYILKLIKHLVGVGIPVMGHLGFTPQFINSLGGYFVQGKTEEQAKMMLECSKKLEEAGVFSIVLEMVPEETTAHIASSVEVPILGIGAGALCDGQILVSDDVFGKYGEFCPKFARKYGDMKRLILNCTKAYIEDVRNSSFPKGEEVFRLISEKRK